MAHTASATTFWVLILSSEQAKSLPFFCVRTEDSRHHCGQRERKWAMQMFGAKVFQAEATAGVSPGLRGTIRRPDGWSRVRKSG